MKGSALKSENHKWHEQFSHDMAQILNTLNSISMHSLNAVQATISKQTMSYFLLLKLKM